MTEVTVTGKALQMTAWLKALMREHGVRIKPVSVPLAEPVYHAVSMVGLASTTDVDLGRQRFRAYAFDNLCLHLKGYELPPLLYRHDDKQIAGTIQSLSYDDRGNLRIRAEVTHDLAKRCNAFSVGARVLEYEIRDAGTENFHALITRAEVTEISLVGQSRSDRAASLSRDAHRALSQDAARVQRSR